MAFMVHGFSAGQTMEENTMRYFAVVALRRADWTEAIVSLNAKKVGAQAFAQRVMAAMPHKFIRCRVRPVTLTAKEVAALCEQWGRDDADEGEPLRAERLPKPYDAAYRRGYHDGRRLARGGRKG
jgi:hypothetical protein